MNTVTVVCAEKRRVVRYGSFAEALESLRWWVVLDEADRLVCDGLLELILGKK